MAVTYPLEQLCINSIRFLAIDAVEKAKSDHQVAHGLPLHIICPLEPDHAV